MWPIARTGAPVDGADVTLWADGKQQSTGKSDSDGLATLESNLRGGAQAAEPENVWILARHGADAAMVTPFGYAFASTGGQPRHAYIYTDRPVYRPGHKVYIKAIVRKEQNDTLVLPDERTLALRVTGPDEKVVFNKELPVSVHGTVAADFDLAADAALGYYNIEFSGQDQFGWGSFYVEEYKKPEYQVTVKVPVAHLLQGSPIQASIEARYFFGEPVAGAKVTYVVHAAQHWWWDEDEADENGEGDESAEANDEDESGYEYGESEQQEHQGVLDANGRADGLAAHCDRRQAQRPGLPH